MICYKKILFTSFISICLTSCTIVKLQIAVPEKFKDQADSLPIKVAGLGQTKKPVSFGTFTTSRIKRGWNFKTSRYNSNSFVTTEDRILRTFNIQRSDFLTTQKHRFQFIIRDAQRAASVYAMEHEVREGTQLLRNSRWLSELNQEKNIQYSFSAVILPQSETQQEPWIFSMYSGFDWTQRKKLFELNELKEEGMLTKGRDTIFIKTIKTDKINTDKGTQHSIPFALPLAYEMRIDDSVCAIIDPMGRILWLYRELDDERKFAIAAVTSALLTRRIQNKLG